MFLIDTGDPAADSVIDLDKPQEGNKAPNNLSPDERSQKSHQLAVLAGSLSDMRNDAHSRHDPQLAEKALRFETAAYERAVQEGIIGSARLGQELSLSGSIANMQGIKTGVDLQERGLKMLEKELGGDHVATLESRTSLVRSHLHNGNGQRASELMQEQRRQLGEAEKGPDSSDPRVASSRTDLISLYSKSGDKQAANELIEHTNEIVKRDSKILPANDPSMSIQRDYLIRHYMEKGNFDQARPLLENAVRAVEQGEAKGEYFTLDQKIALGNQLLRVGSKGEAVKLLTDHRKGLESEINNPNLSPVLSSNLRESNRLTAALMNLGERDLALQFAKKDMDYVSRLPDQENIRASDIAAIRSDLASKLGELGDAKNSQVIRSGTRESLLSLEKKDGVDLLNLGQTRIDLIDSSEDPNLKKDLTIDNLDTLKKTDIKDNLEVLTIRSQTMRNALAQNLPQQARALLKNTIDDFEKVKRSDLKQLTLRQYTSAFESMKSALLDKGMAKEADQIFETVLTGYKETAKENFEDNILDPYLNSLESLASSDSAKKGLQSLKLQRLEMAEQKYGRDNGKVLPYVQDLADDRMKAQDFKSALGLYERALSISENNGYKRSSAQIIKDIEKARRNIVERKK